MALEELTKEARELLINELLMKRTPVLVEIPTGYPHGRRCPACKHAVRFHYQPKHLQTESNRTAYCPYCGQKLKFLDGDYFDKVNDLKPECIHFCSTDSDRPRPECEVLAGKVNCTGCTFYKSTQTQREEELFQELIERMANI